MKRKMNILAGFILMAVIVAGLVSSAQAGGVSTYYSDQYTTRSMSTYMWNNDGVHNYSLSGGTSISTADIKNASIQWSEWSPGIVTVYMDFSGQIGASPTDTFPVDQSMPGNLDGYQFYQSVSTGFYNTGSDERGAVNDPGEDWAYGNAYLSFCSDKVKYVSGYSNFSYNGGYWYFDPQWVISFTSVKAASDFGQALNVSGAQEIPTIPEPATMCLLGFGGVMALARRYLR